MSLPPDAIDAESRLMKSLEKISDSLMDDFEKNVGTCCKKIKGSDPAWLDEQLKNFVTTFKSDTMATAEQLLSRFAINEKCALIRDANKFCTTNKPWRPCGIPSLDTNAHLFQLRQEHRQELTKVSSERWKELRSKLAELARLRHTVEDALLSLEALASRLDELSNSPNNIHQEHFSTST